MNADVLHRELQRIGEAHRDQAIKYAFEVRDLKRVMWRAIHQLRVGKVAEARQTLERALVK
jgi:hypothetical protein